MKKETTKRKKMTFSLKVWAKDNDFADFSDDQLAVKENPDDIARLTTLPENYFVSLYLFSGKVSIQTLQQIYIINPDTHVFFNTSYIQILDIKKDADSRMIVFIIDKGLFVSMHHHTLAVLPASAIWKDRMYQYTPSFTKDRMAYSIYRLLQSCKDDNENGKFQMIKKEMICALIKCSTFQLVEIILSGVEKDNRSIIYESFIHLLETEERIMRTADEYADILCTTSRTLLRICRKFSGKTTGTMITEAVLKRAGELLEDKSMKTRHIALSIGFASEKSFTHFFSSHMGMTPAKYRCRKGSSSGEVMLELSES